MNKSLLKFNAVKLPQILIELECDVAELQQHVDILNTPALIDYFLTTPHAEKVLGLLALGLPKREAIWWAYLAAQQVDCASSDIKIQNTLKICETWVRHPSEELRRQAQQYAELCDLATASSWVAMGIFWSGDNIARADSIHPVAPAEFMTGHAVSNAVLQALAFFSKDRKIKLQHFLRQGLHIAMGGNGRIGGVS